MLQTLSTLNYSPTSHEMDPVEDGYVTVSMLATSLLVFKFIILLVTVLLQFILIFLAYSGQLQ